MNTCDHTFEPLSRIGTAYAAVFAAFEEADSESKQAIILSLENVAASLGLPFQPVDEETVRTVDELHEEFRHIIETVADAPEEQRGMLTEDLEEVLAIYAPMWCARQVGAHKLWQQDPASWERLMGLLLKHVVKNPVASAEVTWVVIQHLNGIRGAGRN
jgi:hypothetical protein